MIIIYVFAETDFPTVKDIINAKILLEPPPAVVLEIEVPEENTKKSEDCIVISEASGSIFFGNNNNMASSSIDVVQQSPSINNLKKTPSDTESLQSVSAKGAGSCFSGNSSTGIVI